MATKDVAGTGPLDGAGLRVALIRTRWNPDIIDRLAQGVHRALTEAGVVDIDTVEVPGAFELPFAARAVATSGRIDAIVAVGAVIRGETTHYDIVSEECARGLQDVQLSTGVPIGFGVLATENLEQALARSEAAAPHTGSTHTGSTHTGSTHNVGFDAAQVAIEMALLAGRWR